MTTQCVLPGYETSKPEDQILALQKTLQRVYSTDEGKIALNVLLTDLFFLEEAQTEKEKNLCEYAKYFLRERLGLDKTFVFTNKIIETVNPQGR